MAGLGVPGGAPGAPPSLDLRRSQFGARDARWKLQDSDVPEMNLRAFRFKAQVTLLLSRARDAVDEPAVDGKLDCPIDRDDVVGVPFAFALAPVLERLAALAARIVGVPPATPDAGGRAVGYS